MENGTVELDRLPNRVMRLAYTYPEVYYHLHQRDNYRLISRSQRKI
uniref:Uncharacterized protein n=1 Tax=Ascaris lumbricoides TaxID=6252 RepID=A0A0M3IQT0_ASCLU